MRRSTANLLLSPAPEAKLKAIARLGGPKSMQNVEKPIFPHEKPALFKKLKATPRKPFIGGKVISRAEALKRLADADDQYHSIDAIKARAGSATGSPKDGTQNRSPITGVPKGGPKKGTQKRAGGDSHPPPKRPPGYGTQKSGSVSIADRRGGARIGAGRPATGRVVFPARLQPATLDYARSYARDKRVKISEVLEAGLRLHRRAFHARALPAGWV